MTNFNEQPPVEDEKPFKPSLRLVKNEDDAPLPETGGVTPEQKELYKEAHRIFGEGAHRPDAPGRPIKHGMDNLQKAKFSNRMTSYAMRLAANMSPKYRDLWLKKNGIDPNAPEISKATGGLHITPESEDEPNTKNDLEENTTQ